MGYPVIGPQMKKYNRWIGKMLFSKSWTHSLIISWLLQKCYSFQPSFEKTMAFLNWISNLCLHIINKFQIFTVHWLGIMRNWFYIQEAIILVFHFIFSLSNRTHFMKFLWMREKNVLSLHWTSNQCWHKTNIFQNFTAHWHGIVWN